MIPSEIRVRFRRAGGHTDVTFWTGQPGFTFANVGTLTMSEEDEALFRDVMWGNTRINITEDYRREEPNV